MAEAARAKGVPTEVMFLGAQTGADVAARHGAADLVVANNVFAHVPDIVDFSRGLRALVADTGSVSIEIPHLLRLIEGNEYDTIYHEHFSYVSLLTSQRVLAAAGLTVVDVEELPTHGGSIRIWSLPTEFAGAAVARGRAGARRRGGGRTAHPGRPRRVRPARWPRCATTSSASCSMPSGPARRVVAYGAPGKGNTLLNHCGVRADLIQFAVDRNPFKHGRFLPGTHIPIHPAERLAEARPDYVVIMPWNLRTEIASQLSYVREWGGRLVVALPKLEVFES